MEESDVCKAQSAIFETQHTTKGTEPRPNRGWCQAAAVAIVKNVTGLRHPQPTLSYALLMGHVWSLEQ